MSTVTIGVNKWSPKPKQGSTTTPAAPTTAAPPKHVTIGVNKWSPKPKQGSTTATGAPVSNPGSMPKPKKNPLTEYLARFGIDYKDAPKATPALLAFFRGLGMTMDSAEDMHLLTKNRMEQRKIDRAEQIATLESRGRRGVTGNLASRGTLRSGEANTRFARLDEDVGQLRTQKLRDFTEGVENADMLLTGTGDSLRQQALERVLNAETTQAQDKAVAAANEKALKDQKAENDRVWEREQAAKKEADDKLIAEWGKM